MENWKIRYVLERNFENWEIADKLIKKIVKEKKQENVNYLLLQFYYWDLKRISAKCDTIDEILRTELKD